jgi:transposase
MVMRLVRGVKHSLRKLRRETSDKGLAMRCQIVLLAGRRSTQREVAESLDCAKSWVNEVLRRFRQWGIAGLVDGRSDNGQTKVDEEFLGQLYELVNGSPQDYGYRRPTWTRELLVKVMHEKTGVKVHVTTMSRALAAIGARRGRPKPTVACPWEKAAKQRRLAAIRRMLARLPASEVAFYVDEVDVHLNPKIGLDWMNRGTQKQVLTPGKNEKHYLAGALDAHTGKLTWVEGQQKNSWLFLDLLIALAKQHCDKRVIHIVLDNYRIHDSEIVRRALAEWKGRVKLHFLPPYCPDHNKIERVWKDLHDNVTRNHRCATMKQLLGEVRYYLRQRNRNTLRNLYLQAA